MRSLLVGGNCRKAECFIAKSITQDDVQLNTLVGS